MKMLSRTDMISITVAQEAVRQFLNISQPLVASCIDLRYPRTSGSKIVVVDVLTPYLAGGVKPQKFAVIVAHSSMVEMNQPVQLFREDEIGYPVAEFIWNSEPPSIQLTRR